jgi:SAM-dependent methyltransferase
MKKIITKLKQTKAWKLLHYLWLIFPESSLKRLIRSYFYNKEEFLKYKSASIFSDIYAGKVPFWKQDESKSGGGSTLAATSQLRTQLPDIIDKFAIKSMLDVPCGDYNWMKTVPKNFDYIGGDIVAELIENNKKRYTSERVKFQILDITKDELPEADLIFCRECLQHLSNENVKKALNNFKRSGAKYLLVTSYPKTWRNWDIYDGDCRSLNLRKAPFYLPRPIHVIKENVRPHEVGDKTMCLYQLDTIKYLS